ncbi:MAG TPA: uroporphyrinogen-III synthase, partial [Thermoanaerobaculia bacterium]|nr:uroporphyrinogen-III synthase [Thermoanaerobaculia bacterium]
PLNRRIDRVIFTSRNAVEAFRRAGLRHYWKDARYDCVGRATADAVREWEPGVEVPAVESAAGLLAVLPADLSGEFVFWPHGEDADASLADELRNRGASVYAPTMYRKVPLPFPADLGRAISGGAFGAFGATAPSAARWLFEHLSPAEREALSRLPAACLGSTTEGELARLGASDRTITGEATFSSLAATLVALLQRSKR